MKKLVNKYDPVAKKHFSCIDHGHLAVKFQQRKKSTGNVYITSWYNGQIPLEKILKNRENIYDRVHVIYYTSKEVLIKYGRKYYEYLCVK